jgi:hypothetical protein
MMLGIKRMATTALALACLAGSARASVTVNFSYSGTPSGGFTLDSSGTGSFTFADGLAAVGLADLTSFGFTQTVTDSRNGDFLGTFTYGLSSLTSFSATVGPGPGLTGLGLTTGFVLPSPPGIAAESFTVSSLGTGGASTTLILGLISEAATAGTVTITSIETTAVPEPGTAAMLASGIPIALMAWRRRGRRAR